MHDLCIAVAFVIVVIKLYTTMQIAEMWNEKGHKYGEPVYQTCSGSARSDLCSAFTARDYPQSWPISIPRVSMPSDETVHFNLTSAEGAAEWSAIVPGSGLVYLGHQRTPFMLSMFHQLQCLDIVRRRIVDVGEPGQKGENHALVRHCLNYLRQMILCRGDAFLEAVQDLVTSQIDEFGVYQCGDWATVYEEVTRNQNNT